MSGLNNLQNGIPNVDRELSYIGKNHIYNYMIDSAIIIKMDNMVVYNANDCSPCDKAIKYIKDNDLQKEDNRKFIDLTKPNGDRLARILNVPEVIDN